MKRIGSVVVCCIGVAAIGAGLAYADTRPQTPTRWRQRSAPTSCTPWASRRSRRCTETRRRANTRCGTASVNTASPLTTTSTTPPSSARRSRRTRHLPANPGGMTFNQSYGTNHNDRNAFGKCVSTKVQAIERRRTRTCRTRLSSAGRSATNPANIAARHHWEVVHRLLRYEQEQEERIRQVRLAEGEGAAVVVPGAREGTARGRRSSRPLAFLA